MHDTVIHCGFYLCKTTYKISNKSIPIYCPPRLHWLKNKMKGKMKGLTPKEAGIAISGMCGACSLSAPHTLHFTSRT